MTRSAWLLTWAALSLAGCLSPSRPVMKTPFELGREAAASGDYVTAITQFTLAANASQDFVFVEAHLERGECYQKIAASTKDLDLTRDNLSLAIRDFDFVLEEATAEPVELARAHYNLGMALLAQGLEDPGEESLLAVLSVDPPPDDPSYRLEAHRRLGWLYVKRAQEALTEDPTADEEVESQEKFRLAQEQFSQGLRLDSLDSDLNLGKGLCLHFRSQNREAIQFLRASTQISEANGDANARGHYYLARALELQSGFHLAALDHYAAAIRQDEEHTFTPIYENLVQVLPVYLEFDDPRFQWFLDQMLAYSGSSSSYWREVEALADRLVGEAANATSSTARSQRELWILARALARARIGKIEEAVDDALLLKDNRDFLQKLSRVFPTDPSSPCYLYGKALTLLGAKKYTELGLFFEEDVFEPANDDGDCYPKALVLKGRNILERWLHEQGDAALPLTTPEDKLERDKTLGEARNVFQVHLDRYGGNREIRMSLGKVQELMEAYAAAFLNYAILAKQVRTDPEPFARIVALHSAHLLPQSDMADAWSLLLDFEGEDAAIDQYVSQTREAILAEARLYCQGCGRKTTEADVVCPECGRLLGPIGRKEPEESP